MAEGSLHLQGGNSSLTSGRVGKQLDRHFCNVASSSSLHLAFAFLLILFDTGSHMSSASPEQLDGSDLELPILLSPPPTFWDSGYELPCTENVEQGLKPEAWCILGRAFPT